MIGAGWMTAPFLLPVKVAGEGQLLVHKPDPIGI